MGSPTILGHFVMWRSKISSRPWDGAFCAQRHITTATTFRILCGAPHKMRESRTYGSMRGALSNGRPYRARIESFVTSARGRRIGLIFDCLTL